MRISDWSSDVCSSDLATFRDTYVLNINATFRIRSNALAYSFRCHRADPLPPDGKTRNGTMKNRFLTAGLIAAMMVPAVASAAPSQAELRPDRQDVRQEKRAVPQSVRHGDRHDERDERRDLRNARQEYREIG